MCSTPRVWKVLSNAMMFLRVLGNQMMLFLISEIKARVNVMQVREVNEPGGVFAKYTGMRKNV